EPSARLRGRGSLRDVELGFARRQRRPRFDARLGTDADRRDPRRGRTRSPTEGPAPGSTADARVSGPVGPRRSREPVTRGWALAATDASRLRARCGAAAPSVPAVEAPAASDRR